MKYYFSCVLNLLEKFNDLKNEVNIFIMAYVLQVM